MSVFTTTALLYALLILQLVIGVRIVRSRDVFSATMLTGAFSLLGASLFMVLDAADVAFTEAAVGAGISTALVLGALALLRFRTRGPRGRSRGLAFLACLGFFILWLSLVPQMPVLGDDNSPLQAHPATADYFELTAEAIHIPNVVTAVLGSYRGFDTLGEAFVIFIAGLAVYLLLGSTRDRPLEPERDDANG
jgi:multicomponent Na+:H+ antiporter subunit B